MTPMDASTTRRDARVTRLNAGPYGTEGIQMSFLTAQPEAPAAAIEEIFVNTLSARSGSYAVTEAANAAATS